MKYNKLLVGLFFSILILGCASRYLEQNDQISFDSNKGWNDFLYSSFDTISMHTLQSNAFSWKIISTSLLMYYNDKEGLEINLKNLPTIFKKFGFMYPNSFKNLPSVESRLKYSPLGIVKGRTRLLNIFPVEGVNIGCASCHSGPVYDEDGVITNQLWAGQPNTSINFEMYVNEVFNSLLYVVDQKKEFTKSLNNLYPEIGFLEKFTINHLLFNNYKKLIITMNEKLGRLAPYPLGAPGITNGVSALKYQLNIIEREKYNDNEVGFTSIPDISSRELRTSLLYDGVYAADNKHFYPRDEKEYKYSKKSIIKDHTRIISLFTVPTTGITLTQAAQMHLEIDQTVEAIYEEYVPQQFPGQIDSNLAKKGRKLYNNNCASCHGLYSDDLVRPKLISFPNKLSKLEEIQTDPMRAKAINSQLIKHLRDSKVEGVHAERTLGYVGTILDGVWATAPYLHNGSVPTLWHLLFPDKRPEKFLVGGHMLDYEKVGILHDKDDYLKYKKGYQPFSLPVIINTNLPGYSNQGHEIEFSTLTPKEKIALIEFLKLI